MKEFNMAEAAKRQETDEKLANMEQVQEQILVKVEAINPEVHQLTPEDIRMIDDSLPVRDGYGTVEELEFRLYNEPIYKLKMVCQYIFKIASKIIIIFLKTQRMTRLGGKRGNLMVRRVMKRLVTDSVLDEYTWGGTYEKGAFSHFANINDVVYKAVQGCFRKYTEYKYEKYMVDFLKHSSSRQRQPRPRIPRRVDHDEDVNVVDNEEEDENEENVDENEEEENEEEEDDENEEEEDEGEEDEDYN